MTLSPGELICVWFLSSVVMSSFGFAWGRLFEIDTSKRREQERIERVGDALIIHDK